MKIYQFSVRLWAICILALLPFGLLIADEDPILEKECVADSVQCEDEYEQYLKQKNKSKGFFRRELTKRRAYPYIDRAFSLLENGETQKAIVELDKYLAVDPTHQLVRWYRLVMTSKQNDASKLVEVASDFIKYAEESGPVLLIRGNAYIKIGDLEKAEKDFLMARSKNLYGHAQPKELTWILFNLAYSQSDYKKASKWLDELPLTEKNTAAYQVVRANIFERMGQDDEATDTWKSLLGNTKQKEIKIKALTALGRLNEKQSNNAEALSYYLKVLELDTNASVRLDAAEVAWKINDYQKIQLLLEPIVQSGAPTDQKALELKALKALGRLHGKQADYGTALDYYSKALAIEEDTSVRLNAAETAWMLQDYKSTQSLLGPLIKKGTLEDDRALGLRQRYCEAIDKNGNEELASTCFSSLFIDYPSQYSLLSYSADLAHRRGKNDIYISKLKELNKLEPSAKLASSIGYALEKDDQWEEAEIWHEIAYATDKKPEHAISYASSLLSNGNSELAKVILQHVVDDSDSTSKQREFAYNNLASLYFYKKSYGKADAAWEKASQEMNSSIYILRRIVTNNMSEKYDNAYQLAVPYGVHLPNDLSADYYQDWYAAVGETYYKNKDYKSSQDVFESLSRLKPTAANFLSLAESYRASKDYELSNTAYLRAESLSEKNGDTLKERAYMYLQAGMDNKAIPLLKKMHKENPQDALIAENLGYHAQNNKQNKEAINYFKKALDGYEADENSDDTQEMIREKRENITQLILALEKKWSLSLFDGLCIGSNACEAGSEGLLSPFGQGIGQGKLTYKYDSSLKVFTRGLWRNKQDSLDVDRRSFQPTLGFEFQPIKDNNLLLSAEYMFEGGPDTENHVLLRTAWSITKGNDWTIDDSYEIKGFSLKDYVNVYADLGKLFINDDPYLMYAEGRKGKTAIFSKQSLASGFGYLRGSAELSGADEDQHVIDTGVGIEGRYRNLYDRYRGYKLEWNTLLRVGHEIDNSLDKEDLRVNLGIGLRF